MAGLPENTKYTVPSARPSYTPGGQFNALRKAISVKNESNAQDTNTEESKGTTPPKYQALPAGYGEFVTPEDKSSFQYYAKDKSLFSTPNQEDTLLRNINIPGLVEGQYVINKSEPDKIVATDRRDYDSTEIEKRNKILGTRPTDLYQVDHVIPLVMGGADTAANKQLLSYDKHELKTKVQSVPYTLLMHGLISKNEAFTMSTNWENLDASNIPDLDSYGMISQEDALAISNKWKEQQSAPPDISVKDFFKSIPSGVKDLRDMVSDRVENLYGINEDTPDIVKNTLGPLQEIVKGAASSMTFGWINYKHDEDTGVVGQGAGIVGNIAGMVGTIGITSGLASAGMTVVSGGAQKIGFVRSVVNKVAQSRNLISADTTAVKTLNISSQNAGRVKKLYDGIVSRASGVSTKAVADLVGGATVYGQMTPEGFVGEVLGQDEARAGTRMVEDVLFGVTGGIASPNLKGAAFAATSAMMLSRFFDPEDVNGALINGILAGALHYTSVVPTTKKRLQIKEKEYNDFLKAQGELIDTEATRAANNILHTYVGDELKYLDATAPVPKQGEYKVDIRSIRQKALDNLDEMAFGGRTTGVKKSPKTQGSWTFEDYYRERARIDIASKQIDKRGMPTELRNSSEVDLDDLLDFAQKAKMLDTKQTGFTSAPKSALSFVEEMGDKYKYKSFKSFDKKSPSGEYPAGLGRVAGMGAMNDSLGGYNEAVKFYHQNMSAGKASPVLLIVDRPELAPFWRHVNTRIPEDAIKKGTAKKFSHPENAAGVYGIVFGENGKKSVIQLGWVARHFKNVESATAYNKNKWVTEGKLPPVSESINKDTVVEKMREKGINVLLANASKMEVSSKTSGEPFALYTLNDENWRMSEVLANQMKSTGKSDTGSGSAVTDIFTAVNARDKARAVNKAIEKIATPAENVVEGINLDVQGTKRGVAVKTQNGLSDILRRARLAIEDSADPVSLKDNISNSLQIQISENEARYLFNNRESVTVKNILNLIKKASEDGRASSGIAVVTRENILPFIQSPAMRNSSVSDVVLESRILGSDIVSKKVKVATKNPNTVKQNTLPTMEKTNSAPKPPQKPLESIVSEAPVTAMRTPTGVERDLPITQRISNIAKNNNNIKQKTYESAIEEMVTLGSEAMQSIKISERSNGSRKKYIDSIKQILYNTTPSTGIRIPNKRWGTAQIPYKDRMVLSNKARTRLLNEAEYLVETNFHPSEEIQMKTSLSDMDEKTRNSFYKVIRADTKYLLGDKTGAKELLETIEGVDRKAISKILGIDTETIIASGTKQAVSDSVLLQDGKTSSKNTERSPQIGESNKFQNIKKENRNTGRKILDQIEKGLEKDKGTYERGYAEAMHTGLKKMFGDGYTKGDVAEVLGRTLDDAQGYSSYRWKNLKDTTAKQTTLGSAPSKDYVISRGERRNIKDVQEEIYGTSDTNKISSENLTEYAEGLTNEDTYLYGGLSAALQRGVDPTAKHGVDDARALLQLIQKWNNDIVGKFKNTKNKKYLDIVPEVRAANKKSFFNMTEAEKKAYIEKRKKATDEFFESIANNLMDSE